MMVGEQSDPRDLLRAVQAEYLEMPGLHLTRAQALRLWDLDATTFAVLFDVLVATRFLQRTHRGEYVLADSSR
jgi:hypothetical protein